MKPFQEITDPSVAKALAHPLRSQILSALEARTASPSQLAAELDVPLGVVSYHVRRLTALGFLQLVKRVPRRGAVEHYYAATDQPRITDQAWRAMPSGVKDVLLGTALSSLGAQLGAAAAAGGFDPPEACLSRQRVSLDAQGWRELAAELEVCAKRIEAVERASTSRRVGIGSARTVQDGVEAAREVADLESATVVMLLFRSPSESRPG
jgi:DNA-binding transcriptional ArsR family regulator